MTSNGIFGNYQDYPDYWNCQFIKKMNSDNLQTFITHYVQTPIFVPNQFIKKLLVNKNHEKSLNHF